MLHIIIALGGIVAATLSYARPTTEKLRLTYGLIVGTFASGTVLVMMSPSHLLYTCIAGITYLATVGFVALMARRKFANLTSNL